MHSLLHVKSIAFSSIFFVYPSLHPCNHKGCTYLGAAQNHNQDPLRNILLTSKYFPVLCGVCKSVHTHFAQHLVFLQVPQDDWGGYPASGKDGEIPCRRMRSGSYIKAMGDDDSGDSDTSTKVSPKGITRRDAYRRSSSVDQPRTK